MQDKSSAPVSTKQLQDLQHEYTATVKELIQIIASFSLKDFNTIPFSGSWTAGQVAEHINKSVSGTLYLLNGNVKATQEDPTGKVGAIKDMFLNFSLKFIAADRIQPTESFHDTSVLITTLGTTMNNMLTAIREKDLAATCIDAEVPVFGLLTRLEWVYLSLYHMQRHVQQLKDIRSCLKH
ncbi:MAG TPA: DinB family protein [Flavipsychrobacter sp.]|nr:DinB family protein [Flavipsychrobacter sp.]